jgi:predicted small lipoprotein YifL
MKTFRSALLVLAVAAALASIAGCGNKGDLVRPESKPDASAGT